jgi:hypothetical protein
LRSWWLQSIHSPSSFFRKSSKDLLSH